MVAKRLRSCFRPGDLVVRYGGDEFVALVAPCRTAEAESIGARLLETLCDDIECRGERLTVSADWMPRTGNRASGSRLVAAIGIGCSTQSPAISTATEISR